MFREDEINRFEGVPPSPPRVRRDILDGYEELSRRKELFGAELNPSVIKKSGGERKFLVSGLPSKRKMLSLWERLFKNALTPSELFDFLSVDIKGLVHSENMLLVGRDRIIYDTQIVHGDEPAGEMTLFFYSIRDRRSGWRGYLRGDRVKVVYIETIRVREQSSGYASVLFRYYEKLFRSLGFNQFRLKASLSVGKYYWAKEGFDCEDPKDLINMRSSLAKLVTGRNLPVSEREINRLQHAYDFALFRRDISVPLYRDSEGYYSLDEDETHLERVSFPLGKAFLLASDPWDGFKVIYTDTPKKTGFVISSSYGRHKTRQGHPETQRRLKVLMHGIYRANLDKSLVFLTPYVPDGALIEKIHERSYLDDFKDAVRNGNRYFQTRDCSISAGSYEEALISTGGVLAGVDAVMNSRVDNVFCAVRPPGHHAGNNYAMGFCFLNNVAIGAAYARSIYGVEKIFILDWDVHHGNGSQDIFEEDPLTFFCSIHEHPTFCYPGTGRRMDRGRGEGLGTTLNIPLKPHTSDEELIDHFDRLVIPGIEEFQPQIIFISAGFDGHKDDRIAGLDLTEKSFIHMTEAVLDVADRVCHGRVVSVLEGGYNIDAFARSAISHIKTLQGREG